MLSQSCNQKYRLKRHLIFVFHPRFVKAFSDASVLEVLCEILEVAEEPEVCQSVFLLFFLDYYAHKIKDWGHN